MMKLFIMQFLHSPVTSSHQAHNPNNYGRALMSAPPQATAPNPHTNLLNVYIQIANKRGVSKKILMYYTMHIPTANPLTICLVDSLKTGNQSPH
jgi:hypothetical protein